MITLATKVKNLAFLVIAVLVLGLVAVRYADLGRYLGLSGYYTVHVDLAATGGLFPDADVTYRGVSVGRVGAIVGPSLGGALVTARIAYPWGFYAFAVAAVLAVLALLTVPASTAAAP